MAKIDFGPIDELIKSFLVNEIAKRGSNGHGGIKLISDELSVPSSTVSKILNNLQKPSKKFIDLILEKYNFSSISDLETVAVPDKYLSEEQQGQNVFQIGLDFSLSSIPILLSLKKSPFINKSIQVSYNLTNDGKLNFMSSSQLEQYEFDNEEILKRKIDSLMLQDFLDNNSLDCIVLPENLIDYHYENILPVITLGNADMVVSVIGIFENSSLENQSINNYLEGKDLTIFLEGKKVIYIYYQNSIAEDKFSIYKEKTIFCGNPFGDDYYYNSMNSNTTQVLNEEDVIEKSKELTEDELLLIVGFAPIPVLYHAKLRKVDGRFKHLAFNMTSMLGEKSRTNFVLCVHRRIFDDIFKMDTLNKLCKEIKYSIKELKEYQRQFENALERGEKRIYDNPLVALGPINMGERERVKAAQNQRYIYNLYRFFYPTKTTLKIEEAIRLYQRALIKHFTYKSLVSLPYDFVMELMSKFNSK